MKLPFQNRTEELSRLRRRFTSQESTLVCLYGRRRCGKSRLLLKALEGLKAVYYVGDDREAVLQRRAVANEIARLVEGFGRLEYPGWEELLDRWLSDAPAGAILALDELPFLCGSSPELPSILQKFVDKTKTKALHLVLCGSSQRMMMGMMLDSTAPLYGRADEIIKIEPLDIKHLHHVGHFKSAAQTIEAYAVWGGVPRYWELALEYHDTATAIRELVLNPLGVLHREPGRLLLDELRDTRQASSILSLVGQGCSRISEIAGRIGKPATSLTRPLAVLMEMGFVRREIPFGCSPRDSKRTLYRICDPFFDFWYRFVEPNISLLESSRTALVEKMMETQWPIYLGVWWEEIARRKVAFLRPGGEDWLPASRWWGGSGDVEIDMISRSVGSGDRLLIGEAKLTLKKEEVQTELMNLDQKASRCLVTSGKAPRKMLFIMNWNDRTKSDSIVSAKDIVECE
jgi:AAA+ ATPase superfamily predicted ATPase